jgi:hypothetical protein
LLFGERCFGIGIENLKHPIKMALKQTARMKWKQTAEAEMDGQGAAWTQGSRRMTVRLRTD